ncbi:ABC transporter ATP-binding protein [Kordiimonas laminariae]|uniref:ABC transporter ATP-binding protein n=1 Tax=Kordiimonas laminariae TaxID=2917717 RepID=UPI001FF278AC|nr:ABC transporter ATP-binding protein [Kordiimonas laminariae]MCK0067992.1 ABC transporter ATP-binding protein [Kordiimonas laminariae]
MIRFENVSKYFPTRFGPKYVFKNLNVEIPSDRDVAILGVNGAGKSTLVRLLGGTDFPSLGRIVTDRFISWPLGLGAGFQASMSGRENVRFVCRIHGIRNTRDYEDFVLEFSEIGRSFELPVGSYSSGMRAKFGFAVSMAFDFDTYLIDEIMAVGDQAFKKKCSATLTEKRETANIVLVSHDEKIVREHCNAAILLAYGGAEYYESVDRALFRYRNL